MFFIPHWGNMLISPTDICMDVSSRAFYALTIKEALQCKASSGSRGSKPSELCSLDGNGIMIM